MPVFLKINFAKGNFINTNHQIGFAQLAKRLGCGLDD
jgi:hypothetical protein